MMTRVVSYSYNFEDVLLHRAFADRSDGFYVDVGAHHPTHGSVTRLFYDRGWSGINVEPLPHHARALSADRPRDVTLPIAVSDRRGRLTLFEVEDETTLSTFSTEQAGAYCGSGKRVLEREVEVRTLAEVCEQHVGPREIDFMSIDVEGHERQVIAGADWAKWRPRVLVIEATRPKTNVPSHGEWEPLVLDAGYTFVLFDGINRFYCRSDEPDLVRRLSYPVNILDNFIGFEAHRLEVDAATYRRLGRVARTAAAVSQRVVDWIRGRG